MRAVYFRSISASSPTSTAGPALLSSQSGARRQPLLKAVLPVLPTRTYGLPARLSVFSPHVVLLDRGPNNHTATDPS
jgi:hypothetical protein